MGDYTINRGDCLWNIAKKQYGVKSNQDIVKVVNKIAEVNNIKNPNLIYAGNTLSLPSYESIFEEAVLEEETPAEEPQTPSKPTYEDLNKWTTAQYENVLNGKTPEMFDMVQTDVPYTDNAFMTPWREGITNMATSNMQATDSDNNGVIDYKEYIVQEVTSYNENFPEDAVQYDNNGNIIGDDVMNSFLKTNFDALDFNKNGVIEHTELMAYYAALDASDSSDGSVDGKLQIGALMNTDLTSDFFQARFKGAINIFANN